MNFGHFEIPFGFIIDDFVFWTPKFVYKFGYFSSLWRSNAQIWITKYQDNPSIKLKLRKYNIGLKMYDFWAFSGVFCYSDPSLKGYSST